MDISFSQENPDFAISYLVVMEYPNLKVVYEDFEEETIIVPYVPGFLAFRELNALKKLLIRLKNLIRIPRMHVY